MPMPVIIHGQCLSGGCARLEISEGDWFSCYRYQDNRQPIEIPLVAKNISVRNHRVNLGKSSKIEVVEHLFSALYGLGLFHLKIKLFGNEVPFFDGSSDKFIKPLQRIRDGNSCETLKLNKKILVKERDSFICYQPIQSDELLVEIELCHPFIKTQKFVIEVNKENYINEIAPARTFVFTTEDDPRLKKLPPYGIGITKNGSYCATPLRFPDEPVRHKVLDLIGDLYVLQKRLSGKITAKNTTHRLNQRFVRRVM